MHGYTASCQALQLLPVTVACFTLPQLAFVTYVHAELNHSTKGLMKLTFIRRHATTTCTPRYTSIDDNFLSTSMQVPTLEHRAAHNTDCAAGIQERALPQIRENTHGSPT